MSKKNTKKKDIKKKDNNGDFLDVSYRGKLDIDTDKKYNDEELYALILDLDKKIEHFNKLHKNFYSSNAYIDRIQNRTFIDILREKIASTINSMRYQKNKRKS